jgi:hypothetical protein
MNPSIAISALYAMTIATLMAINIWGMVSSNWKVSAIAANGIFFIMALDLYRKTRK